MNEQLLKQLVRQMKIMNFWISFFFFFVVIAIIICGFLLWQVVSFVNDTNRKIDGIKTQAGDSLNVKKNTCEGNKDFAKFLREKTGACE